MGTGALSALGALATLEVRRSRSVLEVTLARPAARNAMNAALVAELDAVFVAVAGEREVRTVVLRGKGGHFCAGADLKELAARAGAAGEADPLVATNRAVGALLERVETSPQVVVAVCEGAVLGGGLGLACAADVVLVEADAELGLPETTLGLPPAQIALFLVKRLGASQARRLALTGARWRGREAVALGVAHACHQGGPALEAGLADTLAQIARCAPGAIATTKELFRAIGTMVAPALLDRAAQLFAASARAEEAAEGTRAFLEKRRPSWDDREDER